MRIIILIMSSLVVLALIAKFLIFTTQEDTLYVVRNPYSVTGMLLWPRTIKGHWPIDVSWDFEVKNDIFQHASKLPYSNDGYAVIDSGAHIGDGAVPLAAAFADTGRSDIIVYAIEPDVFKCNVIKALANINNVQNIRVICTGLSAYSGRYEGIVPTNNMRCTIRGCDMDAPNSGATTWQPVESGGVEFKTLDSLYKEGIIEHPLGCLHLDVEGMELAVMQGGMETITKDRPYLSVEGSNDTRPFEQLLGSNYTFHRRIGGNNVFLPSVGAK